MAKIDISFDPTPGQDAKLKEAMEYRRDKEDRDNAPHDLNPGQVKKELRNIALAAIRREVKGHLRAKRNEASDDDMDDIR